MVGKLIDVSAKSDVRLQIRPKRLGNDWTLQLERY